MSVTSFKDALDKKNGKQCPICNDKYHQGKCKRGDLVFRIDNLLKANSLIPQLMSANKEAYEHAGGFQRMLKKVDESHILLMDILDGKGPLGAIIKKEYLTELDKWAVGNVPINQDTSEEQLPLFSPESLMLEEKKISDSTRQPSGENSQQNSLQ